MHQIYIGRGWEWLKSQAQPCQTFKRHWTVDVINVSDWFLTNKALGALIVMSVVVISLSYHYLHFSWVQCTAWPEALLTNAQLRFSPFICLRSEKEDEKEEKNSGLQKIVRTSPLCLFVPEPVRRTVQEATEMLLAELFLVKKRVLKRQHG